MSKAVTLKRWLFAKGSQSLKTASLSQRLQGFIGALSGNSSEALLQAYAQSKDPALLAKLYAKHSTELFHFMLRFVSTSDAEDLNQSLWLKLMDKAEQFHRGDNARAWLFTLARNLCLDAIKKQKPEDDCTGALTSDADAVNHHYHQQLSGAINRALLQLPLEQREAFCLQQEGFSLQDIAHMTNTSRETVKSRLRYAKKQLQQQLSELR